MFSSFDETAVKVELVVRHATMPEGRTGELVSEVHYQGLNPDGTVQYETYAHSRSLIPGVDSVEKVISDFMTVIKRPKRSLYAWISRLIPTRRPKRVSSVWISVCVDPAISLKEVEQQAESIIASQGHSVKVTPRVR